MSVIDHEHAVVLSGGGAKGAYEVGLMKALFDGDCPATGQKPINPGILSGTSVGSFNAAVLAAQSDVGGSQAVRHLESIWLDRIADRNLDGSNSVFRIRGVPSGLADPRSLISSPLQPLQQLAGDASFFAADSWNRFSKITRARSSFPRNLLDALNLCSFLSLEPFHHLLSETILAETILNSKKVLRIAATNWRTGKLRVYRNLNGDTDSEQVPMNVDTVRRCIAASTAIPGIFPPVTIDGEPYVDGGAVMNTPLQPGIVAGARVLHVIYLDPELQDLHLDPLESTLQTSGRLFALMMAVITNRDIAAARRINGMVSEEHPRGSSSGRRLRKLTIHRYRPKTDLGGILGLLDFSSNNLKNLIALGEGDASSHNCEISRCVLPDSDSN